MLKRTKYSRLRNDSLTSLEDRPQKMLPLKRDLCLDSDFAQLDPGTPAHHGPSTLRDFIPRVANIRLQSPISLRGLRGQTNTPGDRTIDEHADRPLSRTEWGSGHNQTFCSQPSLPLSTVQNLNHSALHNTKRPITLHRMASLPWTPGCPPFSQHKGGLCCLKTFSAIEDCTMVGTANRAVHHHIKVPFTTHVTVHEYTLLCTNRNMCGCVDCNSEWVWIFLLVYSSHFLLSNLTIIVCVLKPY